MTGSRTGGYTLLEVMVAIAILALALTAIFSSEAGAIKSATRARRQTVATLLARCKMNEVEAHLEKDGFPAVEEHDTDRCCEGGETEGFTCDWKVERIELPDPQDLDEANGPGSSGASAATPPGLPVPPSGVQAPSESGAPSPDQVPSVGDMLSGNVSPQDIAGSAAAGGVGAMALQFAYPVLKPALEDQVRRVTITVKWHEGSREHSFDVVQYVVSPPNDLPVPPP